MSHPVSIQLRALEPEDLEILYLIENDIELWDVGVTNVPYSRYLLRDYLAHAQADIYADRQLRLIVENEEGRAVGIADLTNFDPDHRRAELGIIIMKPYRRRGYAEAAIRQLCLMARKGLRLHQLYAVVDADNEASLQLFRKMGFSQPLLLQEWLFDGKNYHNACLFHFFL